MTYETLKRSHLKRNILIAVVVVAIISAIILNFTRAKYRTTQSMPLIQGTINFSPYDYKTVAMYIDGEPVDTLPDGKYELTEESYCTNEDNEKDESITLSYDSATQGLLITPMNKKGTKCYLYFEEHKIPAGDTILASPNPPTGQTTDWTGGTTYYYTGNPNNWVQFAGFWWRIIRINGDGSIRMIYQGTSANATGTETQIGTSAFDSDRYNKTHVGLVYDGTNQHGYGQPSTIMTTLNNWYNSNLASFEEDYIDTGTGFCSDRNMASGSNFNASGTIYYAPYDRRNGSASLQCHDDDILSKDNGKLQNPIGLVTSDEAVLTGITWDTPNTGSYLYTGETYWTMSPYYFYDSWAYVFVVYHNGRLNNWYVYNSRGVRPVINLKSAIAISGSGTTSDPFKLSVE